MLWAVTLKMKKNPDHDPRNKIVGSCPAGLLVQREVVCSDVTGEHHTVMVEAEKFDEAAALFHGIHVTRVEGPFLL